MINRRYVVTAAHCHTTGRGNRITEVVLGDHDLNTDPDCYKNSTCWKPAQRFRIKQKDITVHDNWDPNTVVNEGNDIALIRLPQAAYTYYELCQASVVPICLPWGPLPNGFNAELPKGKHVLIIGRCKLGSIFSVNLVCFINHITLNLSGPKGKEFTVMGWGRTHNEHGDPGDYDKGGAFKHILQKLDIPHVPTAQCKAMSTSFNQITSDRQVCAGGEASKYHILLSSNKSLVVTFFTKWEYNSNGNNNYVRMVYMFNFFLYR